MKFLRTISILLLLAFSIPFSFGQYEFEVKNKIECTDIKNQARTGTCWSFASSSFIESEMIRQGKGNHDLSEMFVVRNIYKDKARNYMLRQGKANFSQGSLAHDLMRIMAKDGMVPESVYSGLVNDEIRHDHSEMEKGLKGYLDGVRANKSLSTKWPLAFESILDVYLGKAPSRFTYQGKSYTPKEFAQDFGLDPSKYKHITSFSHHPFGESFILEIPDNYSNGAFYNIEIEKLMSIIDNALAKGYTIAWDGDVSEKGFSSQEGMAILPVDPDRDDLFLEPGEELEVTQESRQAAFESYSTTDDHLMHIVGVSVDKSGNKYYIIKNSWGERGPDKGYLHMSIPYMKMKTVSITLHEDAIGSMLN